MGISNVVRTVANKVAISTIEAGLDLTAHTVNAAASLYGTAGLAATKLVSGAREIRVEKVPIEREVGKAPYYLSKKDHFIESLDGEVDLLLAEVNFDRVAGADEPSGLKRK
jgi:hypothetical protein